MSILTDQSEGTAYPTCKFGWSSSSFDNDVLGAIHRPKPEYITSNTYSSVSGVFQAASNGSLYKNGIPFLDDDILIVLEDTAERAVEDVTQALKDELSLMSTSITRSISNSSSGSGIAAAGNSGRSSEDARGVDMITLGWHDPSLLQLAEADANRNAGVREGALHQTHQQHRQLDSITSESQTRRTTEASPAWSNIRRIRTGGTTVGCNGGGNVDQKRNSATPPNTAYRDVHRRSLLPNASPDTLTLHPPLHPPSSPKITTFAYAVTRHGVRKLLRHYDLCGRSLEEQFRQLVASGRITQRFARPESFTQQPRVNFNFTPAEDTSVGIFHQRRLLVAGKIVAVRVVSHGL